jgi:hypothetical protein
MDLEESVMAWPVSSRQLRDWKEIGSRCRYTENENNGISEQDQKFTDCMQPSGREQ